MDNEIQFIQRDILKIDNTIIEKMKNQARRNVSGKFRYCFHENENSGMQEMLFVTPKTGYARPHMHKEVAETQIVIDGEGYCVLFDSSGDIMDSFKVSPKNSFIYRIQKKIWHMVLPISEHMIIYEVREGKFDRETNIFPEWAPNGDEIERVEQYKQDLMRRIGGK